MKILIAYFSRGGMNYVGGEIKNLSVGNTEVASEIARELTGGTLFKIEPARQYSSDYNACVEQSRKELGANARPAIVSHVENMGEYDAVILGYPCWCGTMPMPVWTFLEAYDFSGKTIFPFCTNEGSGMGRSEDDIRALCPGAKVMPGLSVLGSASHESEGEFRRWLGNLVKA